jgi:hypothetical protein
VTKEDMDVHDVLDDNTTAFDGETAIIEWLY